MTILELKRYFKNELSELYSESESAVLFGIFAYKTIGFNQFQLRKFSHQQVLETDIEDFENVIIDLKSGKPYQHILGETEFYGFSFFVNENVLIPRPETEELLEFAIKKIRNSRFEIQDLQPKNLKILDIGTGSGIIPIILKKHFPEAEISAIDISEKALEMAKKNSNFHKTEITFIKKDFLNEILDENFDIIISNPPYIGIDEETEIADSVKDFEPKIALFSPISDALIFYRKIAEFSQNNLTENGMIFLEINQKLGLETLDLFKNLKHSELIKDISGNDRILFAQK